jgi:hypothetical protein
MVSLWLICCSFFSALATAGGPPRFDGERAMTLLTELCNLGPRVPGTGAHAEALAFLADHLREHADRVEFEVFPASDPPYSPEIQLTNVVARFDPGRTPRILLGAHWDSRPYADEDPDSTRHDQPVLGANDAASACAVLLHLAELFKEQAPAVGVDLVFFDGEDGGLENQHETYCLGSREHVRRLRQPRPAYAIVVDMIGDRDLTIYAEAHSMANAREIVHTVWGRAAHLGISEFMAEVRYEVFDDHIPFLLAGIPAIDIIDFDYPHWHTVADTPDKCSAASLAVVGEVLASLLYEP